MNKLWFPEGRHEACRGDSAKDALQSATESVERARRDRWEATRMRLKAEEVAALVRAHNTANRYDDWLREVMRSG